MKLQTKIDLLKALLKKTSHLKDDKTSRLILMGYLLGAMNIMSCREQRDGIISNDEAENRFECVDAVESIINKAAEKLVARTIN
jgi:hypothetical protein